MLEDGSKSRFEDLTIELCRTKLPAEKAGALQEKLLRKKEKEWPKVKWVAVF